MLSRTDLVYIDTITNPFGSSVQIKGGVCHFLKDKNHNGLCNYNNIPTQLNRYDVLVESKFIPLIEQVIQLPNITQLYRSKGYHHIPLTDKRLHSKKKTGDVRCFVSKQKGSVQYIKKPSEGLGKYKVITPTASSDSTGFSHMFIGNKNDVHSQSYLSFETDTREEAESLLSYLQCKIPNLLLCLRKKTHSISKKTCEWIPLPPLDRLWTDAKISRHFSLTI